MVASLQGFAVAGAGPDRPVGDKGRSPMAAGGPCIIGRQITIRGNLSGSEDLIVEGRIEGTVSLQNHLTLEESGVMEANIDVADVTLNGEMHGDITAAGSVSINASAKVVGNIRAPRIIIEDGARFKGSIDMDVELPEDVSVNVNAKAKAPR
jgi:cytoskeletal protein CcmA (bactofilin family)